ncbi:DUF485 domain-containing protein [Amycolatopsis acidicola]|uniref:DUF485 domain-containing protein n=1 Tax=Amycolatopsis acidicola TaxID=2596893 RepID=A0A5N0V241_9PSEU|nr:DUF485 domain-containing protein [Amycolatopsis acidicola]KAA9158396.1 DUF485 domain-containing protein [Amycolatopsis acidicola]
MQNVVPSSSTTRNPAGETGQMPVLFDTQDETQRARKRIQHDYIAIQRGPEFQSLRSRFRRFVFPMSALFVVWYLVYVLLAAYAHGFMSIRVFGEINIAMIMGVLQFVSTGLITWAYLRFAKRRLDPEVDRVRQQAGV